ncbi:hypothetical protein ABTX80_08730 [Streptomyces erythrochromogenes]|uniref:hypothetical protein n=1 Tax=Streptomyces erythrochromogenes TaxID=285574 RepID=UPI00332C774A
MSRTSLRTKLAAVATTGVMALGTGVLAATPAHAAPRPPIHGCNSGEVCIYPTDANGNATWNGDRPSNRYTRWGGHALYDQYNWHYVVNNQTDRWTASLCRDSAGYTCENYRIPPGVTYLVDLTPFNSIRLDTP